MDLQRRMAETPSVKDLPKIAESLKGELMQEHALKHTDPNEKIVLPSAEDLKMEKTHQNILSGNFRFKIKFFFNNVSSKEEGNRILLAVYPPCTDTERFIVD
jgi:hypothetical protein